MQGFKSHLYHRPLSLFSGGTRPKNFTLVNATPTLPLGSQDTSFYDSFTFPKPLTNPCPEGTSCYGNCLVIIPMVFNCFLDLEDPLILYYDSPCLHHAQPLLEHAQRRHLHRTVEILGFVHFIVN